MQMILSDPVVKFQGKILEFQTKQEKSFQKKLFFIYFKPK